MVGLDYLMQRLAEVADQRAADAAGVHLVYANARVLHKAAVNADLAELVFDQHDLLAAVGFFDHFLDERGFARAKKTGVNINRCHECLCFLSFAGGSPAVLPYIIAPLVKNGKSLIGLSCHIKGKTENDLHFFDKMLYY